MSGSFYVQWLPGGVDTGSRLIVEIFSASVLGGLSSIYGAILGGLAIGASEILLTTLGIKLYGSWVSIYQKGVPLVIMVITLLVFPQGLVSIHWRSLPRKVRSNRRALVARMRLVLARIIHPISWRQAR